MAHRRRTSTRRPSPPKGVATADMPSFVPPQLATIRSRPPRGNWFHEIKLDGYRIQTHVNNGRVTIYSRSGHDWTKRLRSIAAHFDIPVRSAIFDGELVVAEDNRTNFSELQADLASGRKDRLAYYIFDLLHLDGVDMRGAPLVERKGSLKRLFSAAGLSSPIFYSEHFEVHGDAMFKTANKLQLEGIISKNPDAPYLSERSDAWIKVKCIQKGRFPIVGFVLEIGGISALYLAKREGKELIYAGKVGTGFSHKTAIDVRKKLQPLITPESKLTRKVRKPKAKWVELKYEAEVQYRDITSEGLLRASSFKGLVATKRVRVSE